MTAANAIADQLLIEHIARELATKIQHDLERAYTTAVRWQTAGWDGVETDPMLAVHRRAEVLEVMLGLISRLDGPTR